MERAESQERDHMLRTVVIDYLHGVSKHEDQTPPEEPAVERQEKATRQTGAAPGRPGRPPANGSAPRPDMPPGRRPTTASTPRPDTPPGRRPTTASTPRSATGLPARRPVATTPPLPRRTEARTTATRPTDEPEDVTIDLRDGERIGGIWQQEVDDPTPAVVEVVEPPLIPGSDRYAFSLAVGNSYCYVCGHFAMHQIVLEATPPTRARRLGAYRCRCTLCEYLSSPRPSEIHRAEEYLAANKRGPWDRARRAVGVGRST